MNLEFVFKIMVVIFTVSNIGAMGLEVRHHESAGGPVRDGCTCGPPPWRRS